MQASICYTVAVVDAVVYVGKFQHHFVEIAANGC